MFKFEAAYYLVGFVLVIACGIYLWIAKKVKDERQNNFAKSNLLQRLQLGFEHETLRIALYCLIILGFIISLANPQWGSKREDIKTKRADIFFALDISNSMLGEDISPNRLFKAQTVIQDIVDQFKSNRFGLITFAAGAYLQCPLTTDRAAIKMFVQSANPLYAGTQGTSVAEAIRLAIKAFPKEEGTHKLLFVISDGEDHEGEAIELAKEAKDNNITILSLCIGTQGGANIPIPSEQGISYKRDENGQLLKSIPNCKMLEEIAEITQGDVFLSEDLSGLMEKIDIKINQIAKRQVAVQSFKTYDSYYMYFLWPVLALLIFEFMYRGKHNIKQDI